MLNVGGTALMHRINLPKDKKLLLAGALFLVAALLLLLPRHSHEAALLRPASRRRPSP